MAGHPGVHILHRIGLVLHATIFFYIPVHYFAEASIK